MVKYTRNVENRTDGIYLGNKFTGQMSRIIH